MVDLTKNYFEVFDLPVDYQVDQNELSRRFLAMQKEVHPDRFAGKSDHEKRLSMQWATLVNTANETLKSPLKRAIYMLSLADVNIEHNPELPPAFLMQQIELREELDSIEESESGLDALDAFKAQVSKVMQTLEEAFATSIGVNNADAELAVYEMQFMNRLLQAAKQVEEKMLDY